MVNALEESSRSDDRVVDSVPVGEEATCVVGLPLRTNEGSALKDGALRFFLDDRQAGGNEK